MISLRRALIRFGASLAAVLVLSSSARASLAPGIASLRQVRVAAPSKVELAFDTKIRPEQVKTEFFNDIIQVSLDRVSIYPPKISAVSDPEITKIFVYQYTPKLVRCRISVKGSAERFKDKVSVLVEGKTLVVKLGGSHVSDQISTHSAHADAKAPTAPTQAQGETPEEKALLAKVMAGASADEKGETGDEKKKEKKELKSAPANEPKAEASKEKTLGTKQKPLPSFYRVIVSLAAVLGIFGVLLLGARKLKGKRIGSVFERITRSGFARKGKVIEVVAMHYLGPKKSIGVVKIAGRTLVLGLSEDAISLITQLDGDADAETAALDLDPAISLGTAPARSQPSAGAQAAGATAAGPAVFSDILAAAVPGKPETRSDGPSVRQQIRARLEGYKPL